MAGELLKFAPLQSRIDASFWSTLSDKKLDEFRLSEDAVPLLGSYGPSRYAVVGSQLALDGSSFQTAAPMARQGSHAIPGTVVNLNSLDAFKASDKAALLKQAAAAIWSDVRTGEALSQPALLSRFLLLCYADLKQFHYHYWFALPALKPPSPLLATAPRTLAAAFGEQAAQQIVHACGLWLRPAAATELLQQQQAQQQQQQQEQEQLQGTLGSASHDPSENPDALNHDAANPGAGLGASPSSSGSGGSGGPAPFWLVVPAEGAVTGAVTDAAAAWTAGACRCLPLSALPQLLARRRGAAAAGAGAEPLATGMDQGTEAGAGAGAGADEAAAAAEETEMGAGPAAVGAGAAGQGTGSFLLAASDPSSLEGFPGWPLRNLLLAVAVTTGLRSVQVLCVRESSAGHVDVSRSMLLQVALPEIPVGWCSGEGEVPDAVGWEANNDGKLLPRKVDLSPMMSPTLLSEQAVALNLRLMKWRAAPDLDIGAVAAMRCLLIGAGTLGCAVARCLLAWGVRSMTLLDSSTVAYSNPVRQWLFELQDCVGGGKPKAQAAADALRRIFPSVQVEGRALSVPMPGHAPANIFQEEEMRQAHAELAALVASHDVVFLLTDTRESRWLPTLLAAAEGKLAVTAALGFDGFVVMRHGAPPGATNGAARLGCYFCNDVVAPVDSTRNRPLDQQCTVARPGLAPVASALAVELVAALLQHPRGICAPALNPDPGAQQGSGSGAQALREDEASPALGHVPHMIRGQLSGFSQSCMVGHASTQCTGCSATVVEAYKQRGWDLVLEALKDPSALERVSGLAALHRDMEALLAAADGGDEDGEGQGQGLGQGEGDDEDWSEL